MWRDYLEDAVVVVRPVDDEDGGRQGGLSDRRPVAPCPAVRPSVSLEAIYAQAVEAAELPLLLGLDGALELHVERAGVRVRSQRLRELRLVALEPDVVCALSQPGEDLSDEPHLLGLAVQRDLEARVVGAHDVVPGAGQL